MPAILGPLSNDPKTSQGQIDNFNSIFGDPLVLTSEDLAQSFSSRGLRIVTIEQVSGHSKEKNGIVGKVSINTTSDDLAVLLFTSGSTGYAKAVEYTHSQLISSIQAKSVFHRTNSDTNFLSWICKTCSPLW